MPNPQGAMPFVIPMPQQPNLPPPDGRWGVCDPTGSGMAQRLALSRYGMAVFTSGAVANGGDDIVFAAATKSLFTRGAGDSGADAGIVAANGGAAQKLTQAETNAFKGGGLAPTGGDLFKVVAVSSRVLSAAQYRADSGVRIDVPSMYYRARAAELFMDFCTLTLAYADDDECVDQLGPIGFYPDNAGPSGQADIVTTGTYVAGQLQPLPFPFYAGGRNETDQVTVALVTPRPIELANDGGMQTQAGQVMQVAIRVKLWGVHYCTAPAAS